jgi:hypothetical protein
MSYFCKKTQEALGRVSPRLRQPSQCTLRGKPSSATLSPWGDDIGVGVGADAVYFFGRGAQADVVGCANHRLGHNSLPYNIHTCI